MWVNPCWTPHITCSEHIMLFTTSAGPTTTGARKVPKITERSAKSLRSNPFLLNPQCECACVQTACACVLAGTTAPDRQKSYPHLRNNNSSTVHPPPKSHLDQQNIWFSDFEHLKIDRNRTRTQGITTFPPFDTRRNRIWTNNTYGFLTLSTPKSIEIVPAPNE